MFSIPHLTRRAFDRLFHIFIVFAQISRDACYVFPQPLFGEIVFATLSKMYPRLEPPFNTEYAPPSKPPRWPVRWLPWLAMFPIACLQNCPSLRDLCRKQLKGE